jgi:DNA-binding NarL/FixJ family response regulator
MPRQQKSTAPEAVATGPDSTPTSAAPLVVLVIGMGQPVAETTRTLLASDVTVRAIEQGRETAQAVNGAAVHPQLVLVETDARRADAADAVARIASLWRPVPVLVVTDCEERARNRRLVRAGARGVVTRSKEAEQLASAIRHVHEGEIWLGRGCMSRLIDEMVAADHPMPKHLCSSEGLERLTERERDVVALIAQGMHNKAIAGELGITDHTVRHHLTAIFAKLGVADRLELAVYAFRHLNAGQR